MPKISIIVPAYNAENTLDTTLKSLLNQTYNDYEVVVVNDGSTDNTLDILEKNKSKNQKLRIISTENRGVARARQTGIEQSDVPLLSFCDSDDFVNKTYLEELLQSLENKKSNISCARVGIHFNIPLINKIFFKSKVRPERNIDLSKEKQFLLALNVITNGKLYKRKFVKITDKPFASNEDLSTNYLNYVLAKHISFTNQAFYHYVPNENGLVSNSISGYEYSKMINTFEPLAEMYRLFNDKKLL